MSQSAKQCRKAVDFIDRKLKVTRNNDLAQDTQLVDPGSREIHFKVKLLLPLPHSHTMKKKIFLQKSLCSPK